MFSSTQEERVKRAWRRKESREKQSHRNKISSELRTRFGLSTKIFTSWNQGYKDQRFSWKSNQKTLTLLKKLALVQNPVTKVTHSKPRAGIEPAPSHQAGQVGGRNLPAPGFASKSKNPGEGTIPALTVAVGPILGPKSYAQALVGLAGPGQAIFSCPVNPVQAHPPLSKLGSPIGDPFFNQVPWPQESLSSQPKKDDQIGKTPMTPAAKPFRTNYQPGQDGPSTSQTNAPEDPKNDH
ncbi:hypothetical protein DSO57_1009877 [Entomophthora muscae]|uniref:Uncharacterized protein n=1 Tax=Entomophthora muscae TaxID=34485 RepID=A0ACC2SJT1_9FUNG|nr:hypothetical protein DSO57_1009877 [Entomophthora muscae]